VNRYLPFGNALLILTLASGILPGQAFIEGTLDLADSSQCLIAGWTHNRQSDTKPLQVRVYRDGDSSSGVLVTTAWANQLRSDLPFAEKNRGFSISFSVQSAPGLTDGKGHSIYVYGVAQDGTVGLLNLSGKILHCGAAFASVKDYGAVSDGVTDDSNAIQKAIDETAPGGTVFVPAGRYLLASSHGTFAQVGSNPCGLDPTRGEDAALVIRKANITFRGTGRDSVLQLGPNSKLEMLHFESAVGTLVEKLVFDGNGARRLRRDPATGQYYSWPCGLVVAGLVVGDVRNTGQCTVRDVEVRNGIEDGVGMWLSPDFTVENAYIHDNGGAAHADDAGSQAAGALGIAFSGGLRQKAVNNVVVNSGHGIAVGFGVVGADILDNVVVGGCGAGLILGTSNSGGELPDLIFTVSGNWVEGNGRCGFDGVHVGGAQHGVFSGNFVISNIHSGVSVSDLGPEHPASLDWRILDNVIAGNPQRGLWLRGRSDGILVKGNRIADNGTGLQDQVVLDVPESALNLEWRSVNNLSFSPARPRGDAPRITRQGVVNAASGKPGPVSPGEIVVIYGSGLGPGTLAGLEVGPSGRVSRVISATRVLFDSVPAPLVYAWATQVAAVVPYFLYWKDATLLEVEYNGVRSNALSIEVVDSAPGLFTSNYSGVGQAAILNEDYSLNSALTPASKGSIVMLYATGEGQTDPAGVDGKLASDPLPKPRLPVRVTIGGIDAEVQYSGAASTLVAGVMQVNVRVPLAVASGAAVPVVLTVGAASSQPGTIMAVR
jgi:uncharacterized protein (TIGR03437 family)